MTQPIMDDLELALQQMEKRCDAATEGPWFFGAYAGRDTDTLLTRNDSEGELDEPTPALEAIGELSDGEVSDNWDFVAHARTDLPRLLAAFKVLKHEVEERVSTGRGLWAIRALAHAERLLKGDSPDGK